ncbi:hypothetical protein G6F37_001953 [Rhizopus arrhizus]|nr:hypothetical protein G6F38_001264 [Rhizopus arrhizus]KAG1162649.1 hypothetical protein G6F37_001953 [Rhizopus arrhizus]
MTISTSAILSLIHNEEDQYIEVSQNLWNVIAPANNNKEHIAVSIVVPSLKPCPLTKKNSPSNLTAFLARCKPTKEGKGRNIVYASSHLIKSIYGQDVLSRLDEEEDEDDTWLDNTGCLVEIKAVELIELDEMILGALNKKSYTFAQKDHSALSTLFLEKIIRSSCQYEFEEGLCYEILMTNPVKQGYIYSSERTKVLVVDLSESNIDERSNVLLPTLTAVSFNILNSRKEPNIIEPQEFFVRVLEKKWPEARLCPLPNPQEDDENRVFMRIKDLAKCNIFSGDWVLVSANEPKKSRLCKIYGVEDALEDQDIVYIPPALYFNLELPLAPTPVENVKITITRVENPPSDGAPISSAVTIARVASPTSMDKALQSVCLDSLKQWFEQKERIVCKGDVIAVPINEDSARLRTLDNDSCLKSLYEKPTTLAYFKVVRLDLGDDSNSQVHPSYYGSGRRIIPSKTQMVQTGVEYSRVPTGSISHYYNFVEQLPLIRSSSFAYNQLYELVSSSLQFVDLGFELSCNALFHGPRGGGKSTLVKEVSEALGVHIYEFSVYDILSDTDAKTEAYLRAKFDKAAALAPCVMLIKHMEGLAKKSAVVESGQEPLLAIVLENCIKNVNSTHATTGYPVMVIATTGDIDALPSSVLSCFRHEISIQAPDEKTRLQMLTNLLSDSPLAPDVSLSSLATQTAALVAKDLVDLVARTGVLALQRVDRTIHRKADEPGSSTSVPGMNSITASDIQAAGITLTAADFDAALGEARASYSDSIGAPKIPNVTWDDVGGLAHVKNDILDTIQLPLEHPELFGAGLKKRSGILLYGPPGTGKTLLAKAIATSCSLNFFSVKGPELLNMYIGESEANVRRVFQRARDAKPCVIFFDELDSVAPKRGEKGDSGGVMDRIVSQILAELDGMGEGGEDSGAGDVFVIGATNRPDLLDPALLRPGRFDKLLYLGVSQDHESQLKIIEALTRKFRLHPDLDLHRVAERCPFHYTGADFYALCSDAMLKAMTRVAESIETRVKKLNEEKQPGLPDPVTSQYYLSHLVTPDEIAVQVEEIDFIKALDELVPSVSATELEHYSKVREKFEKEK